MQGVVARLGVPQLCSVLTLGSTKELIASSLALRGLPLSDSMLAFKGIVNGDITPILLAHFLVVLIISRRYFCFHSNALY